MIKSKLRKALMAVAETPIQAPAPRQPPSAFKGIPIAVDGPTGALCASTMCPLFASNGSPWTREFEAPCKGAECGFYDTDSDGCHAGLMAQGEIEQTAENGHLGIPQLGPAVHGTRAARYVGRESKSFDCPYAEICQWQKDAEGLCAPRQALKLGVDPAACAF